MPIFPIGALPPGLAPGAAQPLGKVGAQPNNDASINHFSSSQFQTCRSPRLSIKLAGVPYNFLLDTGAELSVLPSYILSQVSPHFFCSTHALVQCMVLQDEMLKLQVHITYL